MPALPAAASRPDGEAYKERMAQLPEKRRGQGDHDDRKADRHRDARKLRAPGAQERRFVAVQNLQRDDGEKRQKRAQRQMAQPAGVGQVEADEAGDQQDQRFGEPNHSSHEPGRENRALQHLGHAACVDRQFGRAPGRAHFRVVHAIDANGLALEEVVLLVPVLHRPRQPPRIGFGPVRGGTVHPGSLRGNRKKLREIEKPGGDQNKRSLIEIVSPGKIGSVMSTRPVMIWPLTWRVMSTVRWSAREEKPPAMAIAFCAVMPGT